MASLDSLPPELIQEIMRHLPIPYLLAFGLTSKAYHECQSIALSTLRIGVFQSKLSGIASLMDSSEERSSLHSVQVVLPRSETRTRSMTIKNQNAVVECVLKRYQQSLRDLEIALWELSQGPAELIALMRNLRHLAIRLDHPYTRHAGVDRAFWSTSPGSTVWNTLFHDPGQKGMNASCLGRLQSLTLERAGITDYQLQKIVEKTQSIQELRLQKCLLLTQETFEYLANSSCGRRLKVLYFTQSVTAEIDDRLLQYIGKLSMLKVLSLHACLNIDSGLVRKMNEDVWHIPQLTLPHSFGESGGLVEVDPAYK